MYRLKTVGTDQVSFGPVPVLIVVKIIWSTGKYYYFFLNQNICCRYSLRWFIWALIWLKNKKNPKILLSTFLLFHVMVVLLSFIINSLFEHDVELYKEARSVKWMETVSIQMKWLIWAISSGSTLFQRYQSLTVGEKIQTTENVVGRVGKCKGP